MMFATTSVLLSICALAHNDEETTSSLINRLGLQGLVDVQEDAVDESSQARRLGGDTVVAPDMGVEDGPCRSGWQYELFMARCNWGLWCEHTTDGSATYGICRRYGPGPSPIPIEPATGGANQRCNNVGSPCNGSNLRPRWNRIYPSGYSCVCDYFLGSADEGQDQTGAVGSTSPSLGMRAPSMGGRNEPCRNTHGNECDSGLHCHYYTRDGTSTEGRCVPDSHPSHNTGEAGEQCNPAPYAPCNNDNLKPEYHTMYPEGTACTCAVAHNEPRRGEAGGRCNRAPDAPCNASNLQPRYHQLYPHGESCVCDYLLGGN